MKTTPPFPQWKLLQNLLPLPSFLITGVFGHARNLSGLASISVIQKRTASAQRVVDTLHQCLSGLPEEPLAPGLSRFGSSPMLVCVTALGLPVCCTAAYASARGQGKGFSAWALQSERQVGLWSSSLVKAYVPLWPCVYPSKIRSSVIKKKCSTPFNFRVWQMLIFINMVTF